MKVFSFFFFFLGYSISIGTAKYKCANSYLECQPNALLFSGIGLNNCDKCLQRMFFFLLGVAVARVVAAAAAVAPNQGHIQSLNRSPNPNPLNVAAPVPNPSEYYPASVWYFEFISLSVYYFTISILAFYLFALFLAQFYQRFNHCRIPYTFTLHVTILALCLGSCFFSFFFLLFFV